MRIAYLATCSPVPATSGHSLRVAANWQALSRLGEVDLYAFDTSGTPAQRRQWRRLGITPLPPRRESSRQGILRHLRSFFGGHGMLYAKAVSPRRIARITDQIKSRRTDLLVIGDTWLADLLPAFRGAAGRIVVDTHNVESELYRRILAEQPWPSRPKLFLFWRNSIALERHLAAADAVWCVSEADAAFYRERQGLTRLAVLPNAIDTTAYVPSDAPVEPGSIVFTGSYGYWPNAAAALHLVELARDLAAAAIPHRIYLVGRDPTPAMLAAARELPSLTVTGPVPDVRPYIARAALVAAPLTSGSGTKYKVLEAFAMGKAVVTTPVGAEGLSVQSGRDVVVAPDLAGFGREVRRLLADPAGCAALGRAGRAWVDRTHSMAALDAALAGSLAAIGFTPEALRRPAGSQRPS